MIVTLLTMFAVVAGYGAVAGLYWLYLDQYTGTDPRTAFFWPIVLVRFLVFFVYHGVKDTVRYGEYRHP
jgi:hypothetical protein